MCRRNHLIGWCFMAFGVGLLFGALIESVFLCCMVGIALVVIGFSFCQRR